MGPVAVAGGRHVIGRQCFRDGHRCIVVRHIQQAGLKRDDVVAVGAVADRLDGGPADHVFQFPHIAGPGIATQHFFGVFRQPQAAQAQPRAVQFQVAAGQQQHVIAAFAQRRDRNGVDRQAVIEVGPEIAGLHQVAQAAVGGRHDAHVHRTRAVVAQALDLAVLQRAQQFGLHQQRQFAHFIQE
ncbi:hypothetical protein G6F57_020339 [Rhizopus arrhizus]|nr:hypothetical protein G6F57_020339 [Rhizopus arrhizus]